MILAFQRLDQMHSWFDLTITIFISNTKMFDDNKSESAVLIISILYDLLIWNSLIYMWWVYTECASLLMFQMKSIRYHIICMWSMLSICKINATKINQSISIFVWSISIFVWSINISVWSISFFVWSVKVWYVILRIFGAVGLTANC